MDAVSAKLVDLGAHVERRRAHAVACLRSVLERAERGEFVEVMVFALDDEGEATHFASHTDDLTRTIGQLELTKAALIRSCTR